MVLSYSRPIQIKAWVPSQSGCKSHLLRQWYLVHRSTWNKSRESDMRICCINNTHFGSHCLHTHMEVPILAKTSKDWCKVCHGYQHKMLQFAEKHQISPAVPLMSLHVPEKGQGEEAPVGEHQRTAYKGKTFLRPADKQHRHKCLRAPMLVSYLMPVSEEWGSVVVPLCPLSTRTMTMLCGWTVQISNTLWCGIVSSLLQSTILFRDLQQHSALLAQQDSQISQVPQLWSITYHGQEKTSFLLHFQLHEHDLTLLKPFPAVGGVQWRNTDIKRATSSLESFLIAHWSQNKLWTAPSLTHQLSLPKENAGPKTCW